MIFTLSIAATYLILLGLVLRNRTRRDPAEGWLLGYCGYSAVLMGLHTVLIQPNLQLPIAGGLIAAAGFVISVGLVGALTMGYLALKRRALFIWGGAVLIWVVAAAGAHLTDMTPILSNPNGMLSSVASELTLGIEVLIFGWIVLGITLMVIVARAFISERLPLYANRILFWAALVPVLLLGDALSAWLMPPWNYVGYVVRLLGAAGAAYGVLTHRVLDLRGSMRWLISRIILTAVTSAVIFGTIYAAFELTPILDLDGNEELIVAAVLAIAGGILIQPVLQVFRWMLRHLIDRDKTDAAEAVRLYSQRISGQIELRDLAGIATKTANELMGVRRSSLILATKEDDKITLDVVGGGSMDRLRTGVITTNSAIYKHFVEVGRPLLQFDIDYHKDYIAVPVEERQYFSGLEMDIYAPIVEDNQLIGMLAFGPKVNDDPYLPSEAGLLGALANRTVAALENARLVTDLRNKNREISGLNADLKASNERLEKLDAVKSDFISIASHELRTPLTQMQGYADLLIEMSERNLLTPVQAIEIMTSLRRASQRMGEVISSMLDVSQIDVENMDLNFVETSLASIIKLAIDPYSDAIHERNLTLVARGLRGLPPVYADYKRLVQAFENVITNAIKFTPDGGKINVTGEVFEKDVDGTPLSVRITVEDTGIGIDTEHHDLIFEKFYRVGSTQLHSTGSTKFKGAGPGLGLPITKGIIVGHGGRIWVESDGCNEENNPGSAFHIVLPIHPPALEARERMIKLQGAEAPNGTDMPPAFKSDGKIKIG